MTPDVLKEGFLSLPRCHARPGATPFAARLWTKSLHAGLSEWEAYQWLRLAAAHTERARVIAGKRVVEPRGHLVASTRWLADSWGWSRAKVLHFLESLEREGELERVDVPAQPAKIVGATLRLTRYEDFALESTGDAACLEVHTTQQTTEQTTLTVGTAALTLGAQTTEQTTQPTESKNLKSLDSEIVDNARALHGEQDPTLPAVVQFTIAVNQGLMDNPEFGESDRPILSGWGSSITAAEQILSHGVDQEWARRFLYGAAKTVKAAQVAGGRVGSLMFFVARVTGAWDRARARGVARVAPRPDLLPAGQQDGKTGHSSAPVRPEFQSAYVPEERPVRTGPVPKLVELARVEADRVRGNGHAPRLEEG